MGANGHHPAVLHALFELKEQILAWRGERRPGNRMPEELWSAATDLARQIGPSRVSQILKVDYTKLRRLLAEAESDERQSPEESSRFLELSYRSSVRATTCSVELERPDGATMRMWGVDSDEALPICRAFLESAG